MNMIFRNTQAVFLDHSEGCFASDNAIRVVFEECKRATVDREGNIIDLRTGEIDPVLTAQYGMGIW